MQRPYSIVGALLIAFAYAGIGLVPPAARQLPSSDVLLVLIIPAILLGVPFAIWLPHARAGSMGDHWHVPRHTFLMPRLLVCLIGTTMIGATFGTLILSGATDVRYGLLFMMQLFGTIAFVWSARRRFSRHPSSEFVMGSPFPFPLRKRM